MTTLDAFLEKVQPGHRALVRGLDALIREAAPELSLSLKWGNLTYHARRNACSLVPHRHHVNLQLWGGSAMEDPGGLLAGTGKGMRHIRFTAGAPFDRAAVMALVRQAAEAARG